MVTLCKVLCAQITTRGGPRIHAAHGSTQKPTFHFYHILVIDNLFMTLEVPFTTIAHSQYYIIYFMGRLPSEL